MLSLLVYKVLPSQPALLACDVLFPDLAIVGRQAQVVLHVDRPEHRQGGRVAPDHVGDLHGAWQPTTIVMVEGDLGRRLVVRAAAGAPHREEVLHAAALAQQVLQAAAALRPGRLLVRTPLRELRLDEEARLSGEARLEALDRGRVLLVG